MTKIRITDAQLTALETAGIFECPEGDEVILNAAIDGRNIIINGSADVLAGVICDLSNAADERSRDLSGEPAAWARSDAKSLSNLYSKLINVSASQ